MSTSAEIAKRFARRARARTIVSSLFVLVSVIYLSWRVTIFNNDALVLSSVFYAAEIMGLVLGLATIFISLTYRHREPGSAPEGVSVDVFIPTYREPVDLVRRTLRAAMAIDYPHETWLLDDGNRQEMRALAAEVGARYLAREQNTDAKAGNLNNALTHSTAEFVAVFDADHIPMRHALHVLLGFVDDPEIALVQAPQDYYNTTAFQYINSEKTGALWHDQSYFYNIAQGCKDAWNASSCVGTSVLYRRSALEAIGGIPWQTVTEDMHTSLLLHKHGWRTVYVNESIAYGIAAVDLGEYYKTRLRWGHGNVHALRHENILICRGLSLKQRLAYLTLGVMYLEGWQQLIMYSVPIYSLLTGIPPFEITIFNVLCMIGYPLVGYLLLQELACGFGRYWLNEMYGMARFPVYITASFALIRDRMSWRTSSKALKGRVNWALMTPQLAVLALSLAALAYGVARNVGEFTLGPIMKVLLGLHIGPIDWFAIFAPGYNLDLLLVAGFWAVFNVVRCALFVRKVFRNVRESHRDFRFQLQLPLEIHMPSGTVVVETSEISLTSAAFHLPADLAAVPLAQRMTARLYLPSGPLDLSIGMAPGHDGTMGRAIEAQLSLGSTGDLDRLSDCLYSVDWHRGFMNRNAYFLTPLEFLQKLLLPWRHSHEAGLQRRWRPILYRPAGPQGTPLALGFVTGNEASDERSMLVFEQLDLSGCLFVSFFCGNIDTFVKYSVVGDIDMETIGRKGLDGTIATSYTISPMNVIPLPQEASSKVAKSRFATG